MKKSFLIDSISYFFILMFVYTGVAKLMDIHLFREQMISSPFLGPFYGLLTWGLPIGEILLGVALFLPVSRRKALYVTLVIMTLFTVYVVVIHFMDDHLSCSCGGIIEELSPKQHILFNSICILLSTIAVATERRQKTTARFQWLAGTTTLCLIFLLSVILFTAFTAPVTIKTGLEGRLLPSFNVLLPDSSTYFNTEAIPNGKPLIVIGFSPWCIHCQAETRDIIKHIEQLRNIRIWYVTPYPFSQMKQFYNAFGLNKYPNITMGVDTANTFINYFKAKGVPFIGIFDSKKRLLQAFTSQMDVTTLAQIASK